MKKDQQESVKKMVEFVYWGMIAIITGEKFRNELMNKIMVSVEKGTSSKKRKKIK